ISTTSRTAIHRTPSICSSASRASCDRPEPNPGALLAAAHVHERLDAIGELDLDALDVRLDDRAAAELRVLEDVAGGERLTRRIGPDRDLFRAPGEPRQLRQAVEQRRGDALGG